jgi:ankyrin repeat protein
MALKLTLKTTVALQRSIWRNMNPIVDCLLRAGANTELEDFRQLKPLNIAMERRSTDVVRKLLQYGATVKNITALEWRSVFKAKPYDT